MLMNRDCSDQIACKRMLIWVFPVCLWHKGLISVLCIICKWAVFSKKNSLSNTKLVDSDQPVHLQSQQCNHPLLIHSAVSSGFTSRKQRSWSDFLDAQVDLGLGCPPMPLRLFLAQILSAYIVKVYVPFYNYSEIQGPVVQSKDIVS